MGIDAADNDVSPGQVGRPENTRWKKVCHQEDIVIRCGVDRRTLAAYYKLGIACCAPFGRTIGRSQDFQTRSVNIWLLDDRGFLPDWGHLELSYR